MNAHRRKSFNCVKILYTKYKRVFFVNQLVNMAKSFFFAIFSICYLTAQALCVKLDAQNNQLELSECQSRSTTDYSFLSCVLLKRVSACSETCFLIGSIYGVPITSGTCNRRYECTCYILPKASLEVYWNKKFDRDSRNVLREIRKNEALSNNILNVLKTQFQTYQETVSNLKSLLTAKQLEKLRPQDKDAQNIFVADDKFKAVEEYVEKNLKSEKSADGADTKKYLSRVIQKSDGAYFNRIYQEVCRSQNELLIEALNEYNKSRSIETAACSRKEDEGNVIRLIDVAAVNKLIKISSSTLSNQSDPSIREKKSGSTAPSSNDEDVWWKLPGFKKSEIEAVKRGEKEWQVDRSYYVYFKKTSTSLTLTWHNKKHGVRVAMYNYYDRENITQKWIFPNVFIDLNTDKNGTKTNKWQFQNFTYEVIINSDGTILHMNKEGVENKDLIKEYKQRINTWCDANDYIVGKDNCIIY